MREAVITAGYTRQELYMKFEKIIIVECGCGRKQMAFGIQKTKDIEIPKVCNWCGVENKIIETELKTLDAKSGKILKIEKAVTNVID